VPEVGLHQRLAVAELRRGSGEHLAAGQQHVARVAQVQRQRRVLLDEQHGQLRLHLRQRLVHRLDDDRRQAERRLVEHDELRRREQRPADDDHLLLAAGQRPAVPLAQRYQGGEQVVDVRDAEQRLAPVARGLPDEQVVVHGQRREHVPALGDVHQAAAGELLGTQVRHVLPVEGDGAAGRDQARHRAQRRGLAGAVGAEQGDRLTLPDGEGEVFQGAGRPVGHT
jgi:hypothetical protein